MIDLNAGRSENVKYDYVSSKITLGDIASAGHVSKRT